MNRKHRAELAQKTLAILETGLYVTDGGIQIDIRKEIEKCKENTVLYKPGDFDRLRGFLAACSSDNRTSIEITAESTLEAAGRLIKESGCKHVGCLNFASAKNPGGGFLGGSQAQEESLARSSALFASLNMNTQYYEYNRRCGTALYSDHLIFSPFVPVFRDDDGKLLDSSYPVSFITAPAVNAGAIRKNEPHHIEKIRPVMIQRAANVLSVAAYHKCDALVLGAWGCGVFQNNPAEIADIWFDRISENDLFRGKFRYIVFAVFDRKEGQPVFKVFSDKLGRK